jgi:hypothetical protein
MKQLKYSKRIIQETKAFVQLIDFYNNKLNKEYAKNIYNLCKKIADGENLDFEMLKNKYLKKSSDVPQPEYTISNIILKDSDELGESVESENLDNSDNSKNSEDMILDKIIIGGINYYYENKDNGKIFNSASKVVGEFKNKEFLFLS